ncbi:thioredoxin-like protein [Suillus ampliporus]|nr:thioredoxin-like protein [Suillus ampliporus]
MFTGFKRSLPQISIFHHPSSPPSIQALALLRNALASPYPPGKPSAPPLEFDLEVVEKKPPTPDQLKIILSYITPPRSTAPPALSTFLSAHTASPGPGEQPQSVKGIVSLVEQNPNVFKWPVVVDWVGGRASIGDVEGVKEILEAIRQRRDGEVNKEEVDQPKGWFS